MGIYVKRCVIIGLIVLLILPIVACDQEAGLRNAVARAITKTSEVQSYRSSGNTTTYTDEGILVSSSSYEEECEAQDRYRLRAVQDSIWWWEYIKVEDKSYCRYEESGQWEDCSEDDTVQIDYIDIEKQLLPFYWLVIDKMLAKENVNGIECSYYRGRVDMEASIKDRESEIGYMTEQLENMLRWEIDAELWIDGDDYIRQIATETRYPVPDFVTGDEDWYTMHSNIRFFDFDKTIIITPPGIE